MNQSYPDSYFEYETETSKLLWAALDESSRAINPGHLSIVSKWSATGDDLFECPGGMGLYAAQDLWHVDSPVLEVLREF